MLDRLGFIVGAGRSGTTLIRAMCDGHAGVFSPPEMVLAIYDQMAERRKHMGERWWEKGGLRRAVMAIAGCEVDEAKALVEGWSDWTTAEVYAWMQEQLGHRLIVDKCPHLAYKPEWLAKAEGYAKDVRYVWIVRHPGSVSDETAALAAELGYDLESMELPAMAAVSDGLAELFSTARRLERQLDLPQDLDAVEGRRFLLRMLSASIDTFVEYSDADHQAGYILCRTLMLEGERPELEVEIVR